MKTQLYNLPRPMLCDVEKDLDADGFPTMKAVREYMDLHSGADQAAQVPQRAVRGTA